MNTTRTERLSNSVNNQCSVFVVPETIVDVLYIYVKIILIMSKGKNITPK